MKGCSVLMIWAIVLCALATGPPLLAQSRTPEQDRAALTALENEWLANEHNPAALERILASDFVHPVPTGGFVTKAQHIAFSSAHAQMTNDQRAKRAGRHGRPLACRAEAWRRRVTAGKAFESADHCAVGPKTDQT